MAFEWNRFSSATKAWYTWLYGYAAHVTKQQICLLWFVQTVADANCCLQHFGGQHDSTQSATQADLNARDYTVCFGR